MGMETGISFLRNESGGNYHEEFVNSVTFAREIIGKLSGYCEFFSSVSTEHDSNWIGTVDLGVTYALTENLQLDCGCNIGVTSAAGGPPQHRGPDDSVVLAEADSFLRPRFSRGGRLHGPGQLGDGSLRRREVRLRAAHGRHDLQFHGDLASAFVHQAWRRHWPRPRPSVSRSLFDADRVVALDSLRNRYRRMRPGGSRRLRHRFATSFWPSAGVGVHHYRAGRARGTLSPNQRLPLYRSSCDHVDRDHRQLLRRRADLLQAGPYGRHAWIRPRPAHRRESRNALRQHWHSWRDGDAAQSLPTFVHCADAQIRADARRQTRGDQIRYHRFDCCPHVRALY